MLAPMPEHPWDVRTEPARGFYMNPGVFAAYSGLDPLRGFQKGLAEAGPAPAAPGDA